MYVICIYVSMYVCIYVCMYVSMYVCIYVCMYVSMYVYIYIYIYIYIYSIIIFIIIYNYFQVFINTCQQLLKSILILRYSLIMRDSVSMARLHKVLENLIKNLFSRY